MSVIFQDDFDNGSGGAPDGWTSPGADGWSEEASGVVQSNSTDSNPAGMYPNAAPDIADVKVSITQVSTTGDGGPIARWNGADLEAPGNGTQTLYFADSYGTVLETYKRVNGTETLLRTSSVARVANAVIMIEVTGTGGTVTVRQYYNGVQQGLDISDGSTPITVAGKVGILSFAQGASHQYDNFLVEDFATDPSLRINVDRLERNVTRPRIYAPGLAR